MSNDNKSTPSIGVSMSKSTKNIFNKNTSSYDKYIRKKYTFTDKHGHTSVTTKFYKNGQRVYDLDFDNLQHDKPNGVFTNLYQSFLGTNKKFVLKKIK